MDRFCAFCYGQPEKLLKCGQCKHRLYCSVECQRMDWKTKKGGGCHKLYCQVAGEIGVDYEVRETAKEEVGLGVFAMRDFAKNDMIMVERPLVKIPDGRFFRPEIPKSASCFVDYLLPVGGSFQQKWDTNTMACTDEESAVGKESGLFLTLSRMNHDCLGNTDHQYMAHRGVKILVASRCIKKGEEITISYLGSYKPKAERRDKLRRYPYLFECQCTVCVNDDVDQKLARANELDNSILELGGLGKIEAAMRKGRALIAIYDQMQMSSWLYQRTYYDLFQVAITKRKHSKDALRFIRLAHEAILAYTKDKHHPEVVRFKEFMASPENHRNYRLLD